MNKPDMPIQGGIYRASHSTNEFKVLAVGRYHNFDCFAVCWMDPEPEFSIIKSDAWPILFPSAVLQRVVDTADPFKGEGSYSIDLRFYQVFSVDGEIALHRCHHEDDDPSCKPKIH